MTAKSVSILVWQLMKCNGQFDYVFMRYILIAALTVMTQFTRHAITNCSYFMFRQPNCFFIWTFRSNMPYKWHFFNLPVSFCRPLRCKLATFSAFLTDGLVAKCTPLTFLWWEGILTLLTSNLVHSSFLWRFSWYPLDGVVADITNDRTNTSSTLSDEKCTAIFMFSRAISTPCSDVHFCIGKLQTKPLGMWFYGLHSFQAEIWQRNISHWVSNTIGVKALFNSPPGL